MLITPARSLSPSKSPLVNVKPPSMGPSDPKLSTPKPLSAKTFITLLELFWPTENASFSAIGTLTRGFSVTLTVTVAEAVSPVASLIV